MSGGKVSVALGAGEAAAEFRLGMTCVRSGSKGKGGAAFGLRVP